VIINTTNIKNIDKRFDILFEERQESFKNDIIRGIREGR